MDGRRFLRQNLATVGSSLGVVLADIDFYFQWPTIFRSLGQVIFFSASVADFFSFSRRRHRMTTEYRQVD